ncbi:uncharacterized protein LOC142768513 isoform X1 [Rhipicephalus microplus]|uniref:uncharacterized protein LOC142768513 isoform X1 n=1 Tax=Rhipicephalus microplus TaxID=6941 RepID=UPI003F6CA495
MLMSLPCNVPSGCFALRVSNHCISATPPCVKLVSTSTQDMLPCCLVPWEAGDSTTPDSRSRRGAKRCRISVREISLEITVHQDAMRFITCAIILSCVRVSGVYDLANGEQIGFTSVR